MRTALAGPLPEQGEPAARVVEELASKADPGIVASGGPRFFGFVIGGSVPAALAADWLTSAWDQNAGLFVLSPAAAVVEETVLGWLRELFSLPEGTGMGFVTGGQMANTTCRAARGAGARRMGRRRAGAQRRAAHRCPGAAHRAAMARTAAYLQRSSTDRDNYEWTPEFSRRAPRVHRLLRRGWRRL